MAPGDTTLNKRASDRVLCYMPLLIFYLVALWTVHSFVDVSLLSLIQTYIPIYLALNTPNRQWFAHSSQRFVSSAARRHRVHVRLRQSNHDKLKEENTNTTYRHRTPLQPRHSPLLRRLLPRDPYAHRHHPIFHRITYIFSLARELGCGFDYRDYES